MRRYRTVFGTGKEFLIDLDPTDAVQYNIIAPFGHEQYFEHETSLLFTRVLRSGDIAVDVGANVGYFAMLAACHVGPAGRVIAVEANPKNSERIKHHTSINDFRNVDVVNVAAGDVPGLVTFEWGGEADSNGSVVLELRAQTEMCNNRFDIKADLLDNILSGSKYERIKIIKIDTEGFETNVLRGATGVLKNHRVDFIVCELNMPGLQRFGSSQSELRSLLMECGYQTYLLDKAGDLPKLIPANTQISLSWVENILFTRTELLSEYWPVIDHKGAAHDIAVK